MSLDKLRRGVGIGGGAEIKKIQRYTPTIDPASVAANTSAEQTFTVTGVKAGEVVLAVNKPTLEAGLGIVGARISADDTLALTFMNSTALGVDAASETYEVIIVTF